MSARSRRKNRARGDKRGLRRERGRTPGPKIRETRDALAVSPRLDTENSVVDDAPPHPGLEGAEAINAPSPHRDPDDLDPVKDELRATGEALTRLTAHLEHDVRTPSELVRRVHLLAVEDDGFLAVLQHHLLQTARWCRAEGSPTGRQAAELIRGTAKSVGEIRRTLGGSDALTEFGGRAFTLLPSTRQDPPKVELRVAGEALTRLTARLEHVWDPAELVWQVRLLAGENGPLAVLQDHLLQTARWCDARATGLPAAMLIRGTAESVSKIRHALGDSDVLTDLADQPPRLPHSRTHRDVGEPPLAPMPDHAADARWPNVWSAYEPLITPLRERGLVCHIEFGLADFLIASHLPDGRYLLIGPPAEAEEHDLGRPPGWLVTLEHPDGLLVLYDSSPGALEEEHGGDHEPLLEAVDTQLSDLGLLPRLPPARPAPAPDRHAAPPAGSPPAADRPRRR